MTVLNTPTIRSHLPSDAAENWDAVVFAKLAEWDRAPLTADTEFDPPTTASLAAARAWAAARQDAGEPPPTRVGPDGSGGVAFETLSGAALIQRVEISDAGRVDLYEFEAGGRAMRHTPVTR